MTEQAPQSNLGLGNVDENVGCQAGIQRFTTIYSVAEDRLKLSIELKGGETKLLWLTRRLMERVIPELVKIIDRQARRRAMQQPSPTSFDNFQRKTQMQALGKITPQEAVLADRPDESVLVSAITLRQGPQGLSLIFLDGSKAPCVNVPFNEPLLRQWLVVLHQNYTVAGWKDAVWPDWMSLKGGEDTPGALRLN
jgi:hypothetical protein